ncbi:trypsin-like peptidase domain-containing protein [Streptomyces aculeolatus]|uniref:trypsin-like peptidase domain-containing protein n=1 Tax=Streptomyces aculeolatus TaxID=270689 RepID=UPI0027DFA10D|nr:trypsin-like peptidase domain-containing protein [Streptomyces aculeolatus]
MDQGKPSWWRQEPGEPPREAESDTAGPPTDSDASAPPAAPPEDAGPPPGYDPEVDQLRRVREALREWRDGEDEYHRDRSRSAASPEQAAPGAPPAPERAVADTPTTPAAGTETAAADDAAAPATGAQPAAPAPGSGIPEPGSDTASVTDRVEGADAPGSAPDGAAAADPAADLPVARAAETGAPATEADAGMLPTRPRGADAPGPAAAADRAPKTDGQSTEPGALPARPGTGAAGPAADMPSARPPTAPSSATGQEEDAAAADTGRGAGAEDSAERPWEVGVRPYPGAADAGAEGTSGGRGIPAAVSAVAGARAGRAALPRHGDGDAQGTRAEPADGPQDAAEPARTRDAAGGARTAVNDAQAPADDAAGRQAADAGRPGAAGGHGAPQPGERSGDADRDRTGDPRGGPAVEDDDTTQLAVISDSDAPPPGARSAAEDLPGQRRPAADAPAAPAAAAGGAGDGVPRRPPPADSRHPAPQPGHPGAPRGAAPQGGARAPYGPGAQTPVHGAPPPGGGPAPGGYGPHGSGRPSGAQPPTAHGMPGAGPGPAAYDGPGRHAGGPGGPGGPGATAPYGTPPQGPGQSGQWQRYDPWAPAHAAHPPERRRGRLGTLVGALVIALVAGGIGGGIGSYIERNGTAGQVELDQSSAADDGGKRPPGSVAGIARSALPGVVTLRVSGVAEQSTGTGFVLDKRGHILTNNHVVQPAEEGGDITVTFSGGESKSAEVVGGDAGYDLAVVRVKGVSGLKPLRLGNSRSVAVGDPVVAIGAPYDLPNTVTSGIISAKERPITAGGEQGDGSDISYVNALQTDAPINPGNSGGPLLDSEGRVIGINSAIRAADNGGGEPQTDQGGSIGLGFAIPVNKGAEVAEELINTGKATHPVIGVTLNMQYTGDGAQVGSSAEEGGTEPVTPGGPADTAGIQPGDVITGVDGQAVHNGEELIVKIRSRSPGDKLSLTVERDGEELTVDLTLGEGESSG